MYLRLLLLMARRDGTRISRTVSTPIVVFRCVSHFGGVTEDDDLVEEEAIKVSEKKPLGNDVEDEVLENDEIVNIKESKKPKNVGEALKDESSSNKGFSQLKGGLGHFKGSMKHDGKLCISVCEKFVIHRDKIKAPMIGKLNGVDLKEACGYAMEELRRFSPDLARKEPPRCVFDMDDLVSKFNNQFFPPSKTTNLRNEITRFQQKFDESFYEAWDLFNDLLRACPIPELYQGPKPLTNPREICQCYYQTKWEQEKLEEIAITTVNAECSAIILNKVPEKLEDPGKFLIPCALQELDRTNALADSGASINLLPHSIYKQLGLGALKPTRMTLELANRSVTHPMGIAEDVVVRVDGFTFLADFVVVNFEPDPRVPIILGRPFLRTAKALIDLYEEKLTLRVGSDELVFYAEKSEKSKNKQFAHAISVIDFLKDEPFSGSTTNHSDALPPSSSPVKTSDNLEEFADELTLLKKGVHEENFQVYSNPLFEFDDNFNSSNENPLFNEMDKDVENKNSNVSNSDEPVLLNTPLTDKVECFTPEVEIDEIDAFLAMEVSSNFEECYYDSEGDVIFLENLLSDDTTHNLTPEVISDHEPKKNESIHNTSITFSPRNDPLHHEFAGELITLPSRIAREHEEYLSRMTLLYEISSSQSLENVHANPSSIIESLIPIEESNPVQEEIDIFLVPDDLIPPGVENDDSEDEDNELPNLDHQDNPSSSASPPEHRNFV
ncbi:reverse transcriptase domain-containing protein [Tanacetum coccineum]